MIVTGAIALSRKVADERAKRREKKQGHLQVGSSDVAKRAFGAQTSRMIEEGPGGIDRRGTEIKFEDADEINASSPSVQSPGGIYSPGAEVGDARSTSQLNVTSPVQSEQAAFGAASPYTETPTSAVDWRSRSPVPPPSAAAGTEPPPYSARPQPSLSPTSPSAYSDANTLSLSDTKSMAETRSTADTRSIADTRSAADTRSIASGSTNSQGGHGIRVKTKGDDLKSGFPYHPALFDLRIHPDQWENFQYQLSKSTKFEGKDYARMVGAATATAMVGAFGTSVYVGRSMNRKIQEEKIRKGLVDETPGGLGDLLKTWNEDYFSTLGVFVHMELSESAMKNPDGKSRTFRKPILMFGGSEERARKVEERKFVLVVTKLDEEGLPSQALNDLAGKESAPVEIGSSGSVAPPIAEAPGDTEFAYVELPAETPTGVWDKKLDPPVGYVEMEGSGYVEMDADNSRMMEKMQLEGNLVEADPDAEKQMSPRPLSFTKGSESLDKGTT